ncbi:MAG: histidine--tRNA ligase [Patescibacteria group bacterium]|nr:histidine--tRNA ligase [Patescibacteria group bacterium]
MASKNTKKPASKSASKAASKPAAKPASKAAAAPKPAVPPAPKPGSTPQLLRGMRDTLPSEQKYWHFVRRRIENLTRAYGYERIDTPLLEETGLFVRSAGKYSDLVEKEMFTFLDKGGDNVSLRPEGSPGVVRAYINHGMFTLPQPIKLYYVGSMFRYERPQAGRYREHHQFGIEVFGDGNPAMDAEVVLLAYLFYKELGIKTLVNINSLGCQQCRQNYLTELMAYYKPKRSHICEDCKRRYAKNPLRLLDCKEPDCTAVRDGAPHIVDFLDDECKNHLMRVLESLDEMGVPYVLNPHLVRGLDYYTRTVFELTPADDQSQTPQALGGGGRYDNLVEQFGGRPTPACGFGLGLERAILQMKTQETEPPDEFRPDIFVAQLGDNARRKAFQMFEDLRSAGIMVTATFSKNALKSQLETANRLGARYTAIIGQKEVLDGTVLIRDMESGMQEIVDFNKAAHEIRKKLGKG